MQLCAELDPLYGGCCDDHSFKLAAPTDEPFIEKFADDLARMVESIWIEKGMPESIDPVITKAYADTIYKAVQEGFGNTLSSIAYDTPDYEMLLSLQRDVYQFSAAKNYQQLKALTEALVGEDGQLRSKREFRQAAFEINDTHIGRYLDVEREHAIGSAQMASNWVNIQANKDVLPILEFDAILDGRTTYNCRSLNGVRKPVGDQFWLYNYPPLHWRCRSLVRQYAASRGITPDQDIVYPDTPEMFKTNCAAQGVIFPPKHPYYIGLPDSVRKDGLNLIENE
ncbi:Phage Mu protein F like protein [Chitinophaga sp. YR573]|nr:Phage Mu protein F like protein [Chitinophaga sp. YR573]